MKASEQMPLWANQVGKASRIAAEQPDPDAWKKGFLARRQKAWEETPNPYHRTHYEQLRQQPTATP